MKINGQSGLGCKTQIGEAQDCADKKATRSGGSTSAHSIEPMGNMPVIKDLVTDMESTHWTKIRRVTPWLLPHGEPPEREYIVDPESMLDITQSMACIQCGACVSSCLSMEADPDFIGPAALAKAYRFVGDPRDAETDERLHDLAEDPHGIYDCTHCFSCIDACPKGVAPMDQIMRLRRKAGEERDQGPQQRPRPRAGLRQDHREEGHAGRGRCCSRGPSPGIKGKLKPSKRAIKEMPGALPTASAASRRARCARAKRIPASPQAPGRCPGRGQGDLPARRGAHEEFNLYINGEEGDGRELGRPPRPR